MYCFIVETMHVPAVSRFGKNNEVTIAYTCTILHKVHAAYNYNVVNSGNSSEANICSAIILYITAVRLNRKVMQAAHTIPSMILGSSGELQ